MYPEIMVEPEESMDQQLNYKTQSDLCLADDGRKSPEIDSNSEDFGQIIGSVVVH